MCLIGRTGPQVSGDLAGERAPTPLPQPHAVRAVAARRHPAAEREH